MLVVAIDVELGGHLAAEFRLGEHALDRLFHDFLGATLDEAHKRLFAQAAGEAGVAPVSLTLRLEAGEPALARIDDDDVIAHIEEGRVFGVALAAQHTGRFGGEATQGFAAGVDHEPLPADVMRARNICRHLDPFLPALQTTKIGHAKPHHGSKTLPRLTDAFRVSWRR